MMYPKCGHWQASFGALEQMRGVRVLRIRLEPDRVAGEILVAAFEAVHGLEL